MNGRTGCTFCAIAFGVATGRSSRRYLCSWMYFRDAQYHRLRAVSRNQVHDHHEERARAFSDYRIKDAREDSRSTLQTPQRYSPLHEPFSIKYLQSTSLSVAHQSASQPSLQPKNHPNPSPCAHTHTPPSNAHSYKPQRTTNQRSI